MKQTVESLTRRIDESKVEILNNFGVPITLIAREDVPIEIEAIKQVLEVASLQRTLKDIESSPAGAEFWGDSPGSIAQIVITPDFHKGSGIPVGTVIDARGFVIPRAVGNDVCCGMRLLVTDVSEDELAGHFDQLEKRLRAIFFEGERNIPMSPRQRNALLRNGLPGLLECCGENLSTGLWSYYDPAIEAANISRTHMNGSLAVGNRSFEFDDYIQGSGASDGRDAQIGSVGGGNHFVEIQAVDDIIDKSTAYHWGVKKSKVAIMVHSGSVGLGHVVGGHYMQLAKELFPAGLSHPEHGFHVIPARGPLEAHCQDYLSAMHMAANFAFGNRLFLGLMTVRAMTETLARDVTARLIYDAPHNLIWHEDGSNRYLHRKGACPALGVQHLSEHDFFGIPVIIPGSMGDASFLLCGRGNDDLLSSACHGAGRSVARSKARKISSSLQDVERLRVVTAIDPKSPEIAARSDVLAKHRSRLLEEAPSAYKPVNPVIESVESAGIAGRVARLRPLITVKG